MRRDAIIHRSIAAALLLAAIASCSKSPAEQSATPAPAGNALPSANATLTPATWSMDKGVDLARVTNQDKIQPAFSLAPPDVDTALVFANVVTDADKSTPVILRKTDAGWKVVEISSGAASRQWVSASTAAVRHETFAFLDDASDSPAWQLTILHSTDAGLTWSTLAAVQKVANDAQFDAFFLSKSGAGKLNLFLDEDTDGHPHGYYSYTTTDGGKTWSGPAFTGDDTIEADPIDGDTPLPAALKDVEEAATQSADPASPASPAGPEK